MTATDPNPVPPPPQEWLAELAPLLGMSAVTVRLFAAIAEAVGRDELTVPAATVGEVIDALVATGGPDTPRVLGLCSVLVDGRRADSVDVGLPAGATVDVLPPFAGG